MEEHTPYSGLDSGQNCGIVAPCFVWTNTGVKESAKEEIVITNHGRPVGVLKGFAHEDDYLEYRLLNDARFLKIVQRSRREAREGKVTRLDDLQ